MNQESEIVSINEGSNVQEVEEWLNLMKGDMPPQPPSSSAKIKRVPPVLRRNDEEYKKYYVPKVISIGPYHYHRKSLVQGKNIKHLCAKSFLSNKDEKTKRELYECLREPTMLQEVRGFYEENSMSDMNFTRMILQDACFILYYIQKFDLPEELNLNGQEIYSINQDLLLLENQIPFKVLKKVANITETKLSLDPFIHYSNALITSVRGEQPLEKGVVVQLSDSDYDHLFHCWHHALTTTSELQDFPCVPSAKQSIGTVNELIDAGIHFKPSYTKNLGHIEFFKGWRLFSATLKLPPIIVEDSTKAAWLNLLAYEMFSDVKKHYECRVVTSYIRLLRSLIKKPKDVNALQEARVLQHSLGSDNEVIKLFKEIGSALMPDNDVTYSKAMEDIEKHYKSFKNVNNPFSQFKRQYFKSPWTFIALVGAIVALFLTGVQTFFTVWSPKSECDDLCKYLKMNHHL